MPQKCAVSYCKSREGDEYHSFFKFPKEPALRTEWIIAARLGKLNTNSKLCNEHFERHLFISEKGRLRLMKDAIPTRFKFPGPFHKQTEPHQVLLKSEAESEGSETIQQAKARDTGMEPQQDPLNCEQTLDQPQMQPKKVTTVVELSALIDEDGEQAGVRLSSMFIEPNYREDLGRNSIKFDCLCCNLNYVISVKVEKEQKPALEIYPEGEPKALEEIRIDGAPKIKEENPLELYPEVPVGTIEEPNPPPSLQPQPEPQEVGNPLQCPFCLRQTANKQSLVTHLQGHLRYVCDYCNDVIEGKGRLLTHFAAKHRRGIECSICGSIYGSQHHLKAHQANTHSSIKLKCQLCPFETRHKRSLLQHQLTHSNEKQRIVCEICGKSCSQKSNLSSHLRKVHKVQNGTVQPKRTDSFPCIEPNCQQVYNTYNGLSQHLLWHQNPKNSCPESGSSSYPCPECDKSYDSKGAVWRHVYYVHRKKFARCVYCGKLLRKTLLSGHINAVHTKTKSYKCEDCGKEFYFRGVLRNHRRIHTGQRLMCPFEGCLKGYSDYPSFCRHRKQHRLNGDKLRE